MNIVKALECYSENEGTQPSLSTYTEIWGGAGGPRTEQAFGNGVRQETWRVFRCSPQFRDLEAHL